MTPEDPGKQRKDPPMQILFGAKEVGSRAATRVRVQTPQGSAYDGNTGTVAIEHPESGTVMVRLDGKHGSMTLPFGRGELVTL